MGAFWALLLLGFVGMGLRGDFLLVGESKVPKEAVSSQHVSTDSWLARLLGVPKGSDRVLAAIDNLPPRNPILFVSPDLPDATITYFLLSSLAWPRPLEQTQIDRIGQLPENPSGREPAALMIYGGANGAKTLGGEQIGKLTIIRMKRP
jgi:hypothetical protein